MICTVLYVAHICVLHAVLMDLSLTAGVDEYSCGVCAGYNLHPAYCQGYGFPRDNIFSLCSGKE